MCIRDRYNGYKVYWADGAQITWPRDTEIMREVKAVTDFSSAASMERENAAGAGLFHLIGEEMDLRYLEKLKELVQEPSLLKLRAKELTIVYTPLHGTGNLPVRRILKELGFESVYVVEEQEQPDGDFPTVKSPNPEDKQAFAMALNLAEQTAADLVLATEMCIRDRNRESGDVAGPIPGP